MKATCCVHYKAQQQDQPEAEHQRSYRTNVHPDCSGALHGNTIYMSPHAKNAMFTVVSPEIIHFHSTGIAKWHRF